MISEDKLLMDISAEENMILFGLWAVAFDTTVKENSASGPYGR